MTKGAAAGNATTQTILLVEDEYVIMVAVQATLEDAGFTVETHSASAPAMAALEARPANYQALVTDIALVGRSDGWELARRARELKPALAVIYMSGRTQDEWAANGVPHSILVGKPMAPAQIVAAVTSLLNQQ